MDLNHHVQTPVMFFLLYVLNKDGMNSFFQMPIAISATFHRDWLVMYRKQHHLFHHNLNKEYVHNTVDYVQHSLSLLGWTQYLYTEPVYNAVHNVYHSFSW
jgi:hypothetical protein